MKDMSLAPLDQQAKQEMEGSIRFVEGGNKNPALYYTCSSSGEAEVGSNNSSRRNAR